MFVYAFQTVSAFYGRLAGNPPQKHVSYQSPQENVISYFSGRRTFVTQELILCLLSALARIKARHSLTLTCNIWEPVETFFLLEDNYLVCFRKKTFPIERENRWLCEATIFLVLKECLYIFKGLISKGQRFFDESKLLRVGELSNFSCFLKVSHNRH